MLKLIIPFADARGLCEIALFEEGLNVNMLLDLREIINVPDSKVAFDYKPDMSDAPFGSIVRIKQLSRAAGNVANCAGVLMLSANLDVICECVCARCLSEFERPVHMRVKVYITDSGEGENPDGYRLCGDKIDLDEIIVTEFVLNTDDRLLCREDCAGLCQDCGSDLNDGPCSCKKRIDPRLVALGRLLDDLDDE